MSKKYSVVSTWMTISLGILLLIFGIVLVGVIIRAAGLFVPELVQSTVGAATGVLLWFLWHSRKSNQDGYAYFDKRQLMERPQ